MTHSLEDLDRRKLRLDVPAVSRLLPEYFQSEYGVDSGSLTKLLDLYYEYLDSDSVHSFHKEISNLFSVRDPSQNSETYLDEIIKETGNGLQSSSFFQNPRLMAKLLPLFYKSKGSLVATEGFFRGFFGEQVEIEYPKDNLLHVGGIDPSGNQGRIGYEYQNRILDNAIYQIFSILIKTGLSVSEWSSLYKRFAHPGGFHFSGLVQLQDDGTIGFSGQGVNPLESDTGDIIVLDEATQTIVTSFAQMTAIFDSSSNGDPATDGVFRVNLNDAISRYQNVTVQGLERFYSSLEVLTTPNSFTFDKDRVIQYNAINNVGNNQRPIIKDSGAGFAIFEVDSDFKYIEDSANSTNLFDTDNKIIGYNPNQPGSFGFAAGPKVRVTFAGVVNEISAYNGDPSEADQEGDSIQEGDLFFHPSFPLNLFRVGASEGAANAHAKHFRITKLIIDSIGNAEPDMTLDLETMDNDMFTRYLSDSAI